MPLNSTELTELLARITPGTYRLTCDVRNPKPDRRAKYDWRMFETFKAGTRFAVERNSDTYNGRTAEWLEFSMPGKYRSATLNTNPDLLGVIVPYLERIEEKASDLLTREGWSHLAPFVLDRLVAQGTITLDQIQIALQCELDES
jgi:uncharacterized protein (DUF2249 family)